MKYALITDTHFGVRNDSQILLEYQKKFYNEVFFPYLDKNDITHIVHLGDLVDRRKSINFYTLNNLKECFLSPALDRGISIDLIVGNHDMYYKNTNQINALSELCGDLDGVEVYNNPKTTLLGNSGIEVCYVPWVCTENEKETFDELENTSAQLVFGHLEIGGFTMQKGYVAPTGKGLSKSTFDKFDMVFSGHFHYKSDDGHIYYLGNPYETMWSDYNVPKGFHTFDPDSRELEFIQNPYKLFHSIIYDDYKPVVDYQKYDLGYIKNCYVKVVVSNKTKQSEFDLFIDRIYAQSPADVTIIEDLSEFNIDEEIDEAEDTMTILGKYVDGLNLDVDKEILNSKINSLYVEALNLNDNFS